jgi:hypothetical protein
MEIESFLMFPGFLAATFDEVLVRGVGQNMTKRLHLFCTAAAAELEASVTETNCEVTSGTTMHHDAPSVSDIVRYCQM